MMDKGIALMGRKLTKGALVAFVLALTAGVRHDRGAAGGLGAVPGGSERPTPEAVWRALEGAGAAGLRASFDLLESPAAGVRAGAAAYLGARRSALAVPALVRLLRDPESSVRAAAADALGLIGERRALPFLERAMSDPDPRTAQASLLAARRLRSPR